MKGIGEAREIFVGDPINQGDVSFIVPYADSQYEISLSSEDVDDLYFGELARRLGYVSFFDATRKVDLPNSRGEQPVPGLPMLLSVKEVEFDDKYSGNVFVGISVASMSVVYEHGGILSLYGTGQGSEDSQWHKAAYETLPPLKEPEPGSPFYLHPVLEGF